MQIVLYVLHYKCKDEKHQAEIDEACRRNSAPAGSRVMVLEKEGRHNFEDVFALATKEKRDTICCVANADCYWDGTLANVLKMDLWGKFICLTRFINSWMSLCVVRRIARSHALNWPMTCMLMP